MGLYLLRRSERNTKGQGSLGNDTALNFFPSIAAGIDGETVRLREEDWAVLLFCDFSGLLVGGRPENGEKCREQRLFGGDRGLGVVVGREEGRRGGWCLLGLLLRLSLEKEKEKKWEKMEKKREKGRRVTRVFGCFQVVYGWTSEAEAATV
ncbi:hypothetical protein HAX54_001404 [Datura stramonium]|uniref:Uncharacterized protein n=1 Tax=Datura stramonium TaxID=4076 RepID=A0ABS8T4I6_DATST|nr:hypothetical protein [Datura stramonium]